MIKDFKRIPREGEMEMCLCSVCASTYYNMPDHGITRVNMYQIVKDKCTLCGYRMGYDFYVWPKHNVQKVGNSQFCTFVEEDHYE